MTKPSSIDFRSEHIALPVVRIDALDKNFSLPIREFFAANGCQVFTNSSPSLQVSYHFIIGDYEYVKEILQTKHISSSKQILLCWNASEDDGKDFIKVDTKVCLIDPKPISNNMLSDILQFVFTSPESIHSYQTVKASRKHEEIPKAREQAPKAIVEPMDDSKRVEQTISSIFVKQKNNSIKKNIVEKTKKISGLHIVLGILLICSFIVIYFFSSLFFSLYSLYKSGMCLKTNSSCALSWNKHAEYWTNQVDQTFSVFSLPVSFIGQKQLVIPYTLGIDTLHKLTEIDRMAVSIINATKPITGAFLATSVVTDTKLSTVVEIEQIKTQLFALQSTLDQTTLLFDAFTINPPFPFSLSFFSPFLEKGSETLSRVRSDIQTLERILLLYPYISGYKKPFTFLILLQNNTELRPTGGFIGSLMKLTITDGNVSHTEVEDVYTVDGQLKGHVAPPTPIKELLSQEHWYLRDSNWNPDFRESAKQAQWFYEKETGVVVDGVIAVNASLVVKLLRSTGPIKLLDFQDTITADNFYLKSILYTQGDFFPGSTQKKDFLGNLFTSITNTILGGKNISPLVLFETITSGLREKDIQLYIPSNEPQRLIEQFGWGGVVPTKKLCTQNPQTCLGVTTYINEANLGVNKTNFFLDRHDRRDITIAENGSIKMVITRTLYNKASGEPGSGTYRSYTRFFLPKEGVIQSFVIDKSAIPIKDKRLLLPYGEIDTTNSQFTILSVAFDLLPGKETTLQITYDLPETLGNIQKDEFSYFEQKQSGIDSIPIEYRIRFPEQWKITLPQGAMLPMLANDGYLEYNNNLSHDTSIQLRINQ